MSMVDQYPMENRKSYRNNGSIVITKAFIQIVLSVSLSFIQCREQQTFRKKFPVDQ